MKHTAMTPNILFLRTMVMLNAYLVKEDDGVTLVDTMMAGQGAALVEAARAEGLTITRVTLTHGHTDHAGGLDAVMALLPDAEFITTERTARLLSGDHSLDADEPQAELSGGWPQMSTRPVRTVAAGDRIGSLEVVPSPGHSPDHIALLDTRDRALIAGDAFQTLGGLSVSGDARPLFPLPAAATWHRPTALASARALRDLRPSVMAVGHGAPLRDISALDAVIDRAARKFGEGV